MKQPHVEIRRARDGFRWRVRTANGRIVAESGEAYTREHDCRKAYARATSAILQVARNLVASQPVMPAAPRA